MRFCVFSEERGVQVRLHELRQWRLRFSVSVTLISLCLCGSTSATSGPGPAADPGLAWQRTDRYVPPDPNGFFPDDPEGGKKLDTIYQAADKDRRSEEEILSTVRQGFRRTTQRRGVVLAWVGGRYFRAGGTQDPRAVEILYHAVPLQRPEAVHFGLAFVRVKTPNLLRTLADICLQGDSVGEITRGIGSQREELLTYIRPHVQDPDPARREIAEVLVKHFQGELDFEQWQRSRRLEQVKAKFTGQMPQFRETLRTGGSAARYEVLTMMWRQEIAPILDDSFLPALQAAAGDPDPKVRREVARTVAGRWVLLPLREEQSRAERHGADGRRVLPTQELHPDVIPFLFKLASDSDHNVRAQAAGSGLALVLDKDAPIIRRLIELALADWQSGVRSKIISGLRTSTDAAWQRTEQILRAAWAAARTESEKTELLRLYKDVFECEPPAGGQDASSRSSSEAATGAESPGPIQQKINAAAPGATIRLEPGVYRERLTIDKPLTLEGAGWDKTTILVENRVVELVDELKRKAPSSPEELARLRQRLTEDVGRPVLTIAGARGVTVRGLKFSGPGRRIEGQSLEVTIVRLGRCEARLSDCAVVAGPGGGILIADQANAAIERCLVAAVWGTGVTVGGRQDASEVRITDSDIRNCHYAGIVVGRSCQATIERCRVSGAAWHGIRYDDASPQILGNLIFGNARSGIYASGQTAATVKGNLFYANEMGGMWCWFQNQDLVEGNTFASNRQCGLAILGASKPSVRRNIFYAASAGVTRADINDESPFAKSDGSLALEHNLFWANEHDLQKGGAPGTFEPIVLDANAGIVADPQFVAPAAKDFSLKPDSPARQKGIGVPDPLSFASPWPLQPEELAIIPKGDTRDYRQWRDPVSPTRK